MHGVNDDAGSSQTAGQPAQGTCLGAVGVDHVGPERAHQRHEGEEGSEIPPGGDGTHEVGQRNEALGALGGLGVQEPTRAGGQDHVVATLREPTARVKGVSLRPAELEHGDDVEDPHGPSSHLGLRLAGRAPRGQDAA